MNLTTKDNADYVLGHSPREIERLIHQASILRPITERLLRSAGLGPGMRVLDLGCGAGDVSMLAADLVGPNGSVVGIDPSSQVLTVAAERARAAGLPQIRFEQVSLEGFSSPEPFDAVVGRFVLVHQPFPVKFLGMAARLVRPGGSIALHDSIQGGFGSFPVVPVWDVVGSLIAMAIKSAPPRSNSSRRLIECFADAGLPQPNLFSETIIGGGIHSPLYSWAAETLKSYLPELKKMGILWGDLIGIDSLESRLREAVVAARSQITGPVQVCAWATT